MMPAMHVIMCSGHVHNAHCACTVTVCLNYIMLTACCGGAYLLLKGLTVLSPRAVCLSVFQRKRHCLASPIGAGSTFAVSAYDVAHRDRAS